ncbi:T9SS C-terminal target domain-containing protein, partial [candidate division GN15 bacterium]|nr:T9SS C-terminal target domain-containing protein [candidate division GN15 bacterium]
MFRKFAIALFVLCLPMIAFGQVSDDGKPVKVFTDADMVGTYDMKADTVYNLQGFVYVEDGEVLNIEAGTILKGNQGSGASATALVVAQGGTINAVGTPSAPIVMTTIIDDLDDPGDIPFSDARGKWGGLIVLGNAPINTTTGVGQIEGIPETEPRGAYGGTDPLDNSGTLQYVSIRHGGSEIGAANEINGLTMGGVGSTTTIDHVEVIYNLDDGYEWFGGTVTCNNLVAAFCGDDSFDYDEGWSGSGQFWFTIQSKDAGDRGGEHDGGTDPVDGEGFSLPAISNATYLGRGPENGGQRTFAIRDNAGAGYFNSIFAYHGQYAMSIEDKDSEPTDSRDRLVEGNIVFGNNVFWAFGNGNEAKDLANDDQFVLDYVFNDAGLENQIGDAGMAGISRDPDGGLDPRPFVTGTDSTLVQQWVDPASYGYPVAVTGYANALDHVTHQTFTSVDYQGAFDPATPISSSWVAGWTALDFYNYLGDVTKDANALPVKVVTDADIVGDSGMYYWSNDTVYNVAGFLYVDSANTLVVEPGTVV